MRIELKSSIFQEVTLSQPSNLDAARTTSMTNRIHSFICNEDRECRFDADYQAPLGTTGKTASMGKRLLLS